MTSLCIMQVWRNLVTWTVLLQGPQCKYVLDFIVLSLMFSWFLHALIHKLESEILHCIILILMYSAYTVFDWVKRGRTSVLFPEKANTCQTQTKHKRNQDTGLLFVLTTTYVEGVVFVQRPPSQVWGDQFKSVHQSSPPLPLDNARTWLILVADRNCNTNTFTHKRAWCHAQ